MRIAITHLGFVLAAFAVDAAEPLKLRTTDVSFQLEVQRTFEKGNDFLKTTQNSNGWWSTPEHPSVTALALSAMQGEPKPRLKNWPGLAKGYAFILNCARPDGGIYVTGLANYNTSICMMGLLAARDPRHDAVLRKARSFVASQQADLGQPGLVDSPWDGGIGYSHDAGRSDMNNTLTALEALYYTKHLVSDRDPQAKDLNWAAAIQFLQTCQNLPGVNTQAWVSTDAKDRGGFVYDPESSKAGGVTNANGKVALRSYGSISYAGLLSFIYADVKQSDPRVQAVLDWLRANHSLTENPGLGQQGYYYYLHLMTKALDAAKVDELQTKDGRKLDWRRDVALRLIDLQKADGSWQNETGRWWEKDPNLVTAYAVLTLEIIHRGL
jgi:squalene-hopene/tetraprenyl-beta-curcumene cyclase